MDLLPQAISEAILLAGMYSLISVGLSLGFGITRIINFAHGEFVMLGAYSAFWLSELYGIDPLWSLIPIMVAGFVLGYLLFDVIVSKISNAPHLTQILLIFGIALIIQNLAVMLWSGDIRSVQTAYANETITIGNVFIVEGRLVAFVVATILILASIIWLHYSETGRALRAVAQNRDAAILMGVDPRKMFALSFGLNCAFGAAGGVMASFLFNITPFMGVPILLKAFAVVILGGLGSIVGTVIGSFALALTETFVSYYVPDGNGWSEGVGFVLIIAILVLRPKGIAGSSSIS